MTRRTKKISAKKAHAGSLRPTTASNSAEGAPSRANTWENMEAKMVMLIIIFASMFSHVFALLGAPSALFEAVVGLKLPAWAFFALIFFVLLVIAYALEELSVMIIILPILFPLVTKLGFDPIWFGIIMVVWLEIGLITPPVGLNLFVIQGLMPGTTARDVTLGTTPYVLLMILLVVLLFLVPDLALFLPRYMRLGH